MTKREQALIDCIDAELYLKKVYSKRKKFSHYEGKIEADYRDELDEKAIHKILADKNPQDAFYEYIDDCFIDSEGYEIKFIRENIKRKISNYTTRTIDEDFIDEWIFDHIFINYPYDHYLKQEIAINICTEFYNEGNTDFTCNSKYLDGHLYQPKLPKGSITWLVHSQGYTMKDLYDEKNESPFLMSVREELENMTYSMALLTFFVKYELEDLLIMRKPSKSMHILKSTHCGLYNPWHGCTSVLGIKLEKDIHIPVKNIYSFGTDGTLGYSIQEICGMDESFWQ